MQKIDSTLVKDSDSHFIKVIPVAGVFLSLF